MLALAGIPFLLSGTLLGQLSVPRRAVRGVCWDIVLGAARRAVVRERCSRPSVGGCSMRFFLFPLVP